MKIDIDADFVTRALRGMERQIPFALSKALNSVAAEARASVRDRLGETMTLRNRWTAAGIRVENSSKSRLVASVGSLDPYMQAQHDAGPRRAGLGGRGSSGGAGAGSQAVPTEALRRTPATRITRGKQPARLLRKPAHFIARIGGATILWRRYKSGKLKALWLFKRVVHLEPAKRWPLGEHVARVVELTWPKHAAAAVAYALRTARR